MKRKIAAISAALLFFSACSAKTQSLQASENTASSQAHTELSQQAQDIATLPAQDMQTKPVVTEEDFSGQFTDAPYEIHQDFEEIVSLSLVLPSFTLDSEDAAGKINDTFSELGDNLTSFASTTVYETAQERNTIGFVDGSYMASLEDGVLSITYTVIEHYADSDGETTHENVYRFDAATGERLDA